MKLGLGTVQFGMPYGIAHRGEAAASGELAAILRRAAESGIDCLDTAPAYGESEARLGSAMGDTTFRIVTKTPAFRADEISAADGALVRSTFMQSLERLRRPRIYGLLVHHAGDLLKPGGRRLAEAMQDLKRDGLVEKIGLSVYTGDEIDRALDIFEPDLVQLPVNVFDQRLLQSGHVERLRRRGIEIHARSVFLQGLLLMNPDAVPDYFSPLRETLADYATRLNAMGMTRLQGALAFVRGLDAIDYAIVGAQSSEQLEEIVAAARVPFEPLDFSRYAVADEDMVLPSRWKLTRESAA
jgi:aryl-alcohol dehydrogenase-like predicted oxidoreductase